MTFLGTYSIYLPMHYLGFPAGVPRRYFAMGNTEFMPESAQDLNAWITMSALFVAARRSCSSLNVFWSLRKGPESGSESMGCNDARMADAGYSAEARQLGSRPARVPSLGVRLQRAGLRGRLHSAECSGVRQSSGRS